MANIENITVNGFKSLFMRDFPYLPYWVEGKAYFKGDIVYYNDNFYICTSDDGTSDIPDATNSYYTQEQINEIVNKIDNDINTLSNSVDEIKILPDYEDVPE